ncbi:hypothetical protein DFP73DRAFT_569967 [Morchella snyderi]|nr:hypothetical protein DFP73DRAFT_569967 [Morchella snyderi]
MPKSEAGSPTPQPPSRIAFTPMDIDSTPSSSTRIVIDLTIDEAQEPLIQCHRVEPSGQASASASGSGTASAGNPAHNMADILRRLSQVEEGQKNHEAALEGVYVSFADLSSRNDRDEESNRQRHTEVIGLLNRQVDVMTGLTSRMDKGEKEREDDRQRHEEQCEENRKQQQRLYSFLEGGMHTIVQNMGWRQYSAPPAAPGRPRPSAAAPGSRTVKPNVTRTFSTGTSPRPAYDPHRDARSRRKKPQSSSTRSRTPAHGSTTDTASQASTFAGTPGSTPPMSPGGAFGAPALAPVFRAPTSTPVFRDPTSTAVFGASAPTGTVRYESRFFPPVPPLAGNHAGEREESDDGSWVDESAPARPTGRVMMRGGLSRGGL